MLPRCCFPFEYLQFLLPQALAALAQVHSDSYLHHTLGNIKEILMGLVPTPPPTPTLLLPEGLSLLRHQKLLRKSS